jgi:IS5 family transposase
MSGMYRKETTKQIVFHDFILPFGGTLNRNNRWIKLAELIPWEEFEEKYAEQFSESGLGAPAKPFRVALGSLIIKEKMDIPDEEIVEQIRENHYLQYFIGKEEYRDELPFDSSMMVHFRKRITAEMLGEINERIHDQLVKKNFKSK